MRYSARDLAIWRARQRSVPMVLGSATPSLESWHAAETGRYKRVELASRAVAATLPKVRPVDVRREKLQHGLSEHLLRAVEVLRHIALLVAWAFGSVAVRRCNHPTQRLAIT